MTGAKAMFSLVAWTKSIPAKAGNKFLGPGVCLDVNGIQDAMHESYAGSPMFGD